MRSMTLLEHLEELRRRVLIAGSAWFVAACVVFTFRFQLLNWLKQPLPDGLTLNTFTVLEPFMVTMQIASFFGLIAAAPLIFWQIWAFISPGLHDHEKRWSVPFISATSAAFLIGVLFARYLALPAALPILLGFLGAEADVLLSTGDYINKFILYMAIFGLLFQMPVLSYILAKLSLINAAGLRKFRRHSIVGGVALAALVTPTGDPINLAIISVPLILLYELSIFVVSLAQRNLPVREEKIS